MSTYLQLCRACQHEFRAPTAWIGKTVSCPHCRKQIVLQESGTAKTDKLVGQTLGGCRMVKRLGAGAIGVVYEAEQPTMQRRVAVKMLTSKAAGDDKVIQRFAREAELCAAIQHPNVVGVYTCGFERGVHYLVMEFIDGNTLAGIVEERGQLPWQEAAQFILQIAKGLAYAHAKDIIHRDIKPANILVSHDGVAKLADLGLAKRLEDEREITGDGDGGLTIQGIALGSPAYMPPEQIRSAKDVTPSCDLYSLGATFYQLITGKLPFDGRTAPEVMTKVMRAEPPPIAELAPQTPPAIIAFINRTLAKEPAGRPDNAEQFIAELEAAVANPQAVAQPGQGSAARKRGRTPSRQGANKENNKNTLPTWWWIVAAVVVLALIGFIAWQMGAVK
jgi:eukaryotic-like serine/threonine-protein kinase